MMPESARVRVIVRFLLTSVLIVAFAGPSLSLAQTSMEGGARAAALGGATTALAGDVWGQANPASWSTLSGRAVSFFASEAFGLAELRLGAAHYVEPTRLGTFAVGARTFGFEAYRETHLNLGYARGFSFGTTRQFHVGVNARYYRVNIPQYGQAGTLGLSLGGLVSIGSSVYVGFHALNVNVPTLAGHEELPRTLSVGISYTPSERVRVVADAYDDIRFPLAIRAGLEIYPVQALALRAGVGTEPVRFSTGAGVRVGRLRADLAAERHEALGWSPALAVRLQW